MPSLRTAALLALLSATPLAAQSSARAVVDTAIARMGGRVALDSLRTVQYDIVTQWLNVAPDATPLRDGPSYERQSEWRDYRSLTWRNVRHSLGTPAGFPSEYTDLVLDTVGARRWPAGAPASVATSGNAVGGWVPLSVAYVDERRELFAWAPERVVRALADARDLAARPDTLVGGERHAVVAATVDGFPLTALFRRSTGLPTAVRFRADETNDFGLAPWGPMEVEIWYSRWAPNASARVTLPRQWDTKRVGRLYKRMTVLAATFNVPMAADSLAFPDTVRALYLAHGRKPMGDLPIDSGVVVSSGAGVAFHGFGAPAGAVRVGDAWDLVDGGDLPLNAERAAAWIGANAPAGSKQTGAAIMTSNRPGGVAVWAARGGRRVYVGPAGAEAVRGALQRHGAPLATLQVVSRGQWIRGAGASHDSLWVEPIDLVNGSGLVLYAPSQRWAYSAAASAQADIELVVAAIRRRGWAVERVGVPGRFAGIALPKATAEAR